MGYGFKEWMSVIINKKDNPFKNNFSKIYPKNSNDQLKRLKNLFNKSNELDFKGDLFVARAPGRLELIGNYQDNLPIGNTLSCTTNLDTLGVAAKNNGQIRIYDTNPRFPRFNSKTSDLKFIVPNIEQGYSSFLIGLFQHLIDNYSDFKGIDIVLDGKVPIGSGCSSSAALELTVLQLATDTYNIKLSDMEKTIITKDSENKVKGCGFLDQGTVSIGGIVYGDYSTKIPSFKRLDYPWFSDQKLITVIPGEEHGSKKSTESYNSIRPDLEKVADFVGKDVMAGNESRFLNLYQNIEGKIGEEKRILERGKFYIEEYNRVKIAKMALHRDISDSSIFGQMINLSGDGSKNYLKNTTGEINDGISVARAKGGYARVHGGGFGGGYLVMINDSKLDELIQATKCWFPKAKINVHEIDNFGTCSIKL
ncbi:MAG: hypothetical protein WC867_06670 [Candidatus Pacearchaeota archaeon]|jgi:galactokinase